MVLQEIAPSYKIRPRPEMVNVRESDWSKICDWVYRIIDRFDLERELVEICMSILHRFVNAYSVANECNMGVQDFRLSALTSLFLSLKTHSYAKKRFKIEMLLRVSGGEFTADQVVNTERLMLHTLKFHVNPPTSMSLLNEMLQMLEQLIPSAQAAGMVSRQAQFFTELAVLIDTSMARPSVVAFAALLNSMDTVPYFVEEWPVSNKKEFLGKIESIAPHLSPKRHEVANVRVSIWSMYSKQATAVLNDSAESLETEGTEASSATTELSTTSYCNPNECM